jgi:flap endonuclease-1
MGIQGLLSFIQNYAPIATKQININKLKGKVIAIDSSIVIYQFITSTIHIYKNKDTIKDVVFQITDTEGNLVAHLLGILNRNIYFLEHGIIPIWVFDGNPPVQKYEELLKRKQQKIKHSSSTTNIVSAAKGSVRITSTMINDCKKMLTLMGIFHMTAPGEAEAQCASLVNQGIANMTYTEDTDAFVFGCPLVLRGLSKNKEITLISLKSLLSTLKLTYEEFIEFCILCGCDYCPKIEGIGPITAYKLIKKFKTIKEILSQDNVYLGNNVSKNKLNQDISKEISFPIFKYLEKVEQAKYIFTNPEVHSKKMSNSMLKQTGQLQKEKLFDFLVNSKGLEEKRMLTAISKLENLLRT